MKIIEESIKKVLDKIDIDIPEIKILSKQEVFDKYDYKNVQGVYDIYTGEIILVREYLDNEYIGEGTIFHEIGHHIHYKYFNFKKFRFSTKNKCVHPRYRENIENFALCFEQWMEGKDFERTKQMDKILDIFKRRG